jgi:hypothetical protein
MKLVLIAALSLAVVVIAQHPRHCDSPFEFEAHAFQVDPKLQFFRRGHFAQDANLERIALVEAVMNGTNQNYYHEIHLFRERRRYRIDLKSKVCTVEHSDMRFRPFHIPHNSSFVGEAYVGTNAFPDAGVLTTHWEMHNKQEHWHWFGSFTGREVGCVPVMDHFHDEKVGGVTTQFFDVVLGIGDPNIFVPPSSCPHSPKARKH